MDKFLTATCAFQRTNLLTKIPNTIWKIYKLFSAGKSRQDLKVW